MKTEIIEGEKVKLVPLDREQQKAFRQAWNTPGVKDQQVKHLPKVQPAPLRGNEDSLNQSRDGALFMMRTTGEDRLIGFIALEGFDWAARSSWVDIGISDPAFRGKGYGTEAMRLLLRYAFDVLNLNRLNLNVVSQNDRAIRSYEQVGFRYEGTQREVLCEENRRLDIVDMGILRKDWELLYRLPVMENQAT